MSIEIVTHCWAESQPIYADLLRAQLSSLVFDRPWIPVKYTVLYLDRDTKTARVVEDFRNELDLVPIVFTPELLWRRSIGRNFAALKSTADLVWFADCDYLFGRDCIDTVHKLWNSFNRPTLVWPLYYKANPDKTYVDNLGKTPFLGKYLRPDTDGWPSFKCKRAIGGIQVVAGTYAREHGYLNNSKWMSPSPFPFPDTRDDVVFREKIFKTGETTKALKVPEFYRLRHTEIGYGKTNFYDNDEVQMISHPKMVGYILERRLRPDFGMEAKVQFRIEGSAPGWYPVEDLALTETARSKYKKLRKSGQL